MNVKLIAKDSFHTSSTGTVDARKEFETTKSHAEELVKRGLAEEPQAESEAKSAPETENKMAPVSENRAAKRKKARR